MDVPHTSLAILPGDPRIDCAHHQDGRRLRDRSLIEGRTAERQTQVIFGKPKESMFMRAVAIKPNGESLDIPCKDIHFQRVQRARGWRGPQPALVGDTLHCPEQLAKVIKRQRRIWKLSDGSPLEQRLLN